MKSPSDGVDGKKLIRLDKVLKPDSMIEQELRFARYTGGGYKMSPVQVCFTTSIRYGVRTVRYICMASLRNYGVKDVHPGWSSYERI